MPSSDFRDVYSTVLTDWFCLDETMVSTILLNKTYEQLDLGFNCEGLGTNDFGNVTTLTHIPTYRNNRTYIELKMQNTAHVDIKLFSILGQEVASLGNEILYPGNHVIDVKAKANTRLAYGQYIYRIQTGGQAYSKSILIK